MILHHPLIRQLFFFGIVGVIGFIVDAGVLQAGLYLGLGFYGGRVISYICAATATWALNRRWTFKATSTSNVRNEWGRFLLFNLGGFAVNYGAYVACLHLVPLTQQYPVLAVGAGSIAGLFVNFTLNKYFVFNARAS